MSSVNRIFVFIGLATVAWGAMHLLGASKAGEKDDLTHQETFNRDYQIYSLNHPAEVSFSNEPVPLNMPDVYEKFDRELLVNTYWQSNTLLYMKRSHKWFPVIEPILAENKVPDDFKYLALIESGLTQVTSPAGAVGFWQIMEGTGKELGLIINHEIDERYHVEKATQAACKYLLEAKSKYGTWTLAAASYNMGMNGLAKQLDRQGAASYYSLLLNEETSRYLFRILAVKEILSNPEQYGFNTREKDLYHLPALQPENIVSPIADFAEYAKNRGINYKVLKQYNPWLRQSHLKGHAGDTFTVLLPTEAAKHQLMNR